MMADFPDDVDMGWLGGDADGEEEPLFADDLMDDEDDPPPLPPPMPSLGELSANRSRVGIEVGKRCDGRKLLGRIFYTVNFCVLPYAV